jgi:D-alanine-D-alanine ligase
LQRQVDALREQGFEVKVFEGDARLLDELARFLPCHPRRGTPAGIVLNLATGIQGEARCSQVPVMLEMAGIPYTGPGPLAHARMFDRFGLLTMLGRAGVPVPRNHLVTGPSDLPAVAFPAVARPRFDPELERIVVRNRRALGTAVRRIRRAHDQSAVVEELLPGRELRVVLIGNEDPEALPLIERSPERGLVCPAPLGDATAERVRACARAAFRTAGCRDYARVDVRLSPFEEPFVVDVKWADQLARRGSIAVAGESCGHTFAALIRRVINEAAKRCLARAKAEFPAVESGPEAGRSALA